MWVGAELLTDDTDYLAIHYGIHLHICVYFIERQMYCNLMWIHIAAMASRFEICIRCVSLFHVLCIFLTKTFENKGKMCKQ